MLTEGRLDTGEVKLHYVQWADGRIKGPPIVLLHGVAQSWRYWAPLFEALGAGGRIFAIDARGHGQSGWVKNGYRFIDYPRDQQAFLREVVREPAVLVGHSLGGMNALFIAAETPELVSAIVLEDPPLYQAERGLGVFEKIFRWLKGLAESGLNAEQIVEEIVRQMPQVPLAFAQAHAQCIVELDPQTLGQILDGSAAESWETDTLLARVTCPVQLLVGEARLGGALEVAEAERAKQKLAKCRIVFMDGVGHMIHRDRPEAFLRAVQQFLSRSDVV